MTILGYIGVEVYIKSNPSIFNSRWYYDRRALLQMKKGGVAVLSSTNRHDYRFDCYPITEAFGVFAETQKTSVKFDKIVYESY